MRGRTKIDACGRWLALIGALVVASCKTGAAPKHPGGDREVADRLDRVVTDLLAEEPHAGVSVVVVQHGRTVLAKGYGVADVDAGTAAEANTIYRIASMTKSFTAAAVTKLSAEGKIGLDDPIT